MDLNIDLTLVENKVASIKKNINNMNLIELSNELKYFESFSETIDQLIDEIKKTRNKIVKVYKNLYNKIMKLNQINTNYSKQITYKQNLSSINLILLILENYMDQINYDELNAYCEWIKQVDKELKLILNKICYYDPCIFYDLYDKIQFYEKQESNRIEQIKLNENHNSLDEILNKIKGLYYQEIIETLIANDSEPKINLHSYTPGKKSENLTKTLVTTANISEIVGVKKIKTKSYEVNIYHRENKMFTCSCSHFKKDNQVCKHICFLVCSIGKIIKLGFFKSNTLTVQDLNALTDTLANFVT